MMIRVVAIPIAVKVLKIKIVALHRLLAVLDDLHCSLIKRHRRQAWQGAQALLTTRVTRVDLHLIDIHGHTAQAAYRVHNEERAMSMGDALQFF